MKNREISQIFRDIAQVLEIKGENPFRIRAYERAAQNIEGLSEDIENFVKDDRLREIPGVGEDLSRRIKEYLTHGKIKVYEELKRSIPEGLLDLLKIPSIGPKTAKLLFERLRIRNITDLEKAIGKGRLSGIFGIKEKTIENISKGIALLKRGKERMVLNEAMQLADEFMRALKKLPAVENISVAGSLRRRKETVRDIDILAVSSKPEIVMDVFSRIPLVKEIVAKGPTKSSVRTKDDAQVDCRVVKKKSFGAALLYFTGSKNFNIKLRQLAIRKGLKINEYGLYRGPRFIGGGNEKEIFSSLGLDFIAPELREDNGEIECARKHCLPRLVEEGDLLGDLHVHSEWSDGENSLKQIADAAIGRGYRYIAITDHSQSLKVARGLGIAELRKKRREIEKLNRGWKDFRLLYGTEADIDSDGKIDYSDEVLKEFDLVVAAVHTGFKQPREQLTKRVIKACGNKYVHIIAHPTGRLFGARDAYDIDMDKVLRVAKETNTRLEINAYPWRMDLNDIHCRRAKEIGAGLAINTDAHEINQLDAAELGVAMARRGWLSKENIINTLPLEKLLKEIKK